MKKKLNTKLTLKKHTVADLVDREMQDVRGGKITITECNTYYCTNYGEGCRFTFADNSCPGTICN
jgi:natural product precursor